MRRSIHIGTAGAGGGIWTLISHTSKQGTTAASSTTPAINTIGANLIVVGINSWSAQAVPTLSDSAGNTWTLIRSDTRPSFGRTNLFYVINPIVSATHTFTTSQTGGLGNALFVQAMHGSGSTLSVLDQQNGNNLGGGFSIPTNSVTPSINDEFIATVVDESTANLTTEPAINSSFIISERVADAGFTSRGGGFAYQIQTTATTRNPTWSWVSAAVNSAASIATFKPVGNPTIFFRQGISSNATITGTVVGTINTVSGSPNYMVVIVGSENPTVSISDNRGNSYTLLRTDSYVGLPNNVYLLMYECVITNPNASTTITVTSTGGFPTFQAATFAGVITSPVDQQNGFSRNAVSNTIQPGSITPTQNGELVITAFVDDNDAFGGPPSINAGFTISSSRQVGGSNVGTGLAYLIQTTATAANPTWTVGTVGSKTLVASIMSFK